MPTGRHPCGGSLVTINPLDVPDWDAQVAALAGADFFHSTAWAEVLAGTYGFTPVYFTRQESGQLRSVLPLMAVDSWLTGKRGVSLPFTDECAPLGVDAASFRLLIESAGQHAQQCGWRYVEYRGGRVFLEDATTATSFHGHRLALAGGEEGLFAKLHSSVRQAIRKGSKSEVSVEREQGLDAMQAFYRLHAATRRRHGAPPQSFRFFANIQRFVLERNKGFVVLARYQGKPVAGAMFFHFGKRALFKFGASDEAFQHLRPNDLVMWEAIKWLAQHGFEQLSFGRTSLANLGLRRFKLGWGTEEYNIDYVRYDVQRASYVTVPDQAVGWQRRLFRALPVPVLRMAGSVLYRHIA